MTKVLLVTDIFPPDIGGPATFIETLAEGLSNIGYRITVICGQDISLCRAYKFRLIGVSRYNKFFRYKFFSLLVYEMMRHDKILVNGFEYLAYKAAVMARKKYIIKIVGDYIWEYARNACLTNFSCDDFQKFRPQHTVLLSMQQQRTRYLEHAQLVITPSIYLGNLVAGWGIDKDRIATIFNGIQSERFKQSESIRRRNGVLRAIFVGRLTNWKGVETLLLAMRELPLVHLTIVGDGPAMPYLQQLAKQIRQDGTILFLGRLEKELLYREMSQAHVTVLNSLYEGLSHVLLESCAMGIPCIASQCGGNKEVIRHNINGMLIPPQDVSALVGALQNLCDNEEKRYMMAQEAKKTANMFNFKKTLEQIVDVLNLQ